MISSTTIKSIFIPSCTSSGDLTPSSVQFPQKILYFLSNVVGYHHDFIELCSLVLLQEQLALLRVGWAHCRLFLSQYSDRKSRKRKKIFRKNWSFIHWTSNNNMQKLQREQLVLGYPNGRNAIPNWTSLIPTNSILQFTQSRPHYKITVGKNKQVYYLWPCSMIINKSYV